MPIPDYETLMLPLLKLAAEAGGKEVHLSQLLSDLLRNSSSPQVSRA